MRSSIGVDFGGTKVRTAIVTSQGKAANTILSRLPLNSSPRDGASLVAKYLGNYAPHKTDCGYEAFFENSVFLINDKCSGTGNCDKSSETTILFKGRIVYSKIKGEEKIYVPGEWEESLKELETKIRRAC